MGLTKRRRLMRGYLARLTSLSLSSASKDRKIAVIAAESSDNSQNGHLVVSVPSVTPPLSHRITLTFPTASSEEGRGILFADEVGWSNVFGVGGVAGPGDSCACDGVGGDGDWTGSVIDVVRGVVERSDSVSDTDTAASECCGRAAARERDVGAEGVVLNGEQPTASVTVKGVNFPLSLSSMTVARGSIEISSTLIVRDSASGLTVEFGAGKEETSTSLRFGERYEIDQISADSEVFVNSGVEFTVPVPGIVSSTMTELNSETNEHFKVIVSGEDFVPETEWILKLTIRSEDILSMTNVADTSDIVLSSGISVHTPPASTLIGIKAGDDQITPISISPFTFSTEGDSTFIIRVPAPPTLTKVDFSFAATSNTTFHLIVEGTDLPVGETFVVSLDGFDDGIEVRFSSPSGGSSTDLTLQTQPRPNPLIVFVSDSGNSDPILSPNEKTAEREKAQKEF
ncbi:hypothetical protein BLNAU_9457 [Blattamonas nauphoetae]|uniref:Calx-beta domain-containing protein n=1 Tax=Blattamonas nauphoetae TaxID=2049346 RepID=A0ABQ9XVV1_9EUKA|nr:hypothetical protein BLNAU_9457 [Blattamonas nauphoetae]